MRSCPKTGTYSYEQLYWKHVSKEFPGKFKNLMHYDYAKIGRNKLEKIGFWPKFQEVVASRGDFLHPDFPPADIVAANMCGVVSTMEKFIESVSIDVLSAFFTKILEFAMVLRNPDDDSGDVVRRAFFSNHNRRQMIVTMMELQLATKRMRCTCKRFRKPRACVMTRKRNSNSSLVQWVDR